MVGKSVLKHYWTQFDSIAIHNGLMKIVLENNECTVQKTLIPTGRVVLKQLHERTVGGHLRLKKTF